MGLHPGDNERTPYLTEADSFAQATFLIFVTGCGILLYVGKINPNQSQEGDYDD